MQAPKLRSRPVAALRLDDNQAITLGAEAKGANVSEPELDRRQTAIGWLADPAAGDRPDLSVRGDPSDQVVRAVSSDDYQHASVEPARHGIGEPEVGIASRGAIAGDRMGAATGDGRHLALGGDPANPLVVEK